MKLHCLIVDDEPPALDVLESYIQAVDSLEVTARCENAIQAFQLLQQRQVDLLFLDIKMPQLLGTDFVRSLRHPPPVIFTTAYPDYALEGYDLDIVDYLLKPIPFERFLRAIGKVTSRSHPPLAVSTPPSVTYQPNQDAFVYLRTERKSVKVLLSEILYVESLKDYIKIMTASSKPLIVKQSISSLSDMLPPDQFVRIHRSYLINISYVRSFSPQLINLAGQELPIGGLYQKDVQRALRISTP